MRIIVKNLPKDTTKDKLVLHVQKICPGVEVTDCNLKYTRDGVFRQFAFVGFNSEQDAYTAQQKMHGTFIRTAKIQTDMASDVGDGKIKSWSKHSGKAGGSGGGQSGVMNSSSGSGFVIKMKGFAGNYNEKAIADFFKPIKTGNIRIPRNSQKKTLGTAFVHFESEKDMQLAMGRNKNFINGRKIFLKKSLEDMHPNEPKAPPIWEVKAKDSGEEVESIADSGRLFVRNLWFGVTEQELEEVFSKYGPLAEVTLPVDSLTKKVKGFAHVVFMFPEHALKAYTDLDYKSLHGRLMHILPGREPKEAEESEEKSSFKKKKDLEQKKNSSSSHNWNTLFLGANAVADAMAKKYGAEKSAILDNDSKGSVGVRMALGETQIVSETRDFLISNGVALDAFSQAAGERSKTVILVKNLPASSNVTTEELRQIFSTHGSVARVVMPPSGITALVEYVEPSEAKRGFLKLNFSKFRSIPLYLEWAPIGVFSTPTPKDKITKPVQKKETDDTKQVTDEDVNSPADVPQDDKNPSQQDDDVTDKPAPKEEEAVDEKNPLEDVEPEDGASIFVKNLNFSTTDEQLLKHFKGIGQVQSANVSKKKDPKTKGQLLSMGYGFVQFMTQKDAKEALKMLQNSELDGHNLELKISTREKAQVSKRKKQNMMKQTSSKILVRNIPFEANIKEIQELFKVFGELKFVRLPKRLKGLGPHRGFAFVDFITKEDAKRAFNALCHSTHLYGRRLVLEWAQAEESLDDLRKKTAQHFSDEQDGPKKKLRKANILKELE